MLTPDQRRCTTLVTKANVRFSDLRGMEQVWKTLIATKNLLLEKGKDTKLFPYPFPNLCDDRSREECDIDESEMANERAFDLRATYKMTVEVLTRFQLQNNLHRACTIALCRGRAYPHDTSACADAILQHKPRNPFTIREKS